MLLSELFDRLALGELSQHKYGKTGVILESDYPALINQINQGLTALYAHFPIRTKDLILQQEEGVTDYVIAEGDFLRIEEAYNWEGNQIVLNDKALSGSWFTPAWDTLQIPEPVEGEEFTVVYRTKHTEVTLDTSSIDIPSVLEEALQAYIASRCFVSLGNQASASLATYHSNNYQTLIANVDTRNLLRVNEGSSNTKFNQKGFI